MSYHGGIDWDKWYDKIMTASSSELKSIKQEIMERVAAIEETEKLSKEILTAPSFKERNEKKVHPQVIVQSDWSGK